MPAIPYKDTPVVNDRWDEAAVEASISNLHTKATLEQHYAWQDPNGNPDTKAAHEMLHHIPGAGQIFSADPPKMPDAGPANVDACKAALQRMPDSKVPEADRAAVKAHLQAHVDKFEAAEQGKGEAQEGGAGRFASGAGLVELSALLETQGKIWAVQRAMMSMLADLNGRLVDGERLAQLHVARIEARRMVNRQEPQSGVAVVPLKGMITPDTSMLSMLFGGTGLTQFKSDLRSAIANPDVTAVVLDIDSPGGQVDQLPETAAYIRQAREVKPVVAVANTLAASAAYWLGSQAHEFIITPSGSAGSIGVYQAHEDISESLAQAGVKPTLISAGKYKTEGNPFEPLSDEARASAQQSVDDFHTMFVKDISLGRGVEPQEVVDNYGEGRVLLAARAKAAGLADRVATLDQTVSRLQSGRAKVRQVEAASAEFQSSEGEGEAGKVGVLLSREDRHRVFDLLAGTR